jgi:excisionase family DNA binding protein
MSAYLSARRAAALCGVSEKTVRRWIASGKLPAEKVDGLFRVDADTLRRLQAQGNGHAAPPPHHPADSAADSRTDRAAGPDMSAPQAAAPAAAEAAHLAALVAQLHRENVELAGRLGFYQARNAELEERVKLLTAGAPAEASPTPTQAAQRRPRWRFWRPAKGKGIV